MCECTMDQELALWHAAAYVPGRHCMCTHWMAACFCAKRHCGRHLECL